MKLHNELYIYFIYELYFKNCVVEDYFYTGQIWGIIYINYAKDGNKLNIPFI